jgi:transcription initiation factor TFIID subunit 2
LFFAAFSDGLPGNMLSTQFFFKTCRKVSGLDLQSFQDQWVFGSGCPLFRIHTNFVRKKFIVEFHMAQVVRGKAKRATPIFEGSLTVRIHEADGAPFEHIVDIKSFQKTYNLPFNTKYKRTRRSGHVAARFRQLREDLAAEAEDQEEATPAAAETFAYPPWEDDEERANWRIAEWSDDQVETMMGEGGGYEWIRIDPDCEWLASFEFTEKPWYWISQLQSDRDVIAQLDAVQNMAVNPSAVVASELAKTVLVSNYFYRVRMEAARALMNVSLSHAGIGGPAGRG